MFYCDSNLFICPIVSKGAKADAATRVLRALAKGDIGGLTCSLTIDEVLWVTWKMATRGEAVKAAEEVLKFPNLEVVDTSTADVGRAIKLVEKYGVKPRDAIHAACSLNHGIFSIISDDPDFDTIKELKRLSFEKVTF